MTPDLTTYDAILLNTSAGKDSQAMLDVVVSLARQDGVLDRVQAVHADLGRAEWKGTRELAQEQCDLYGVPLRIVHRPQGDLLQQIEDRGMFPSSAARYCTSDQKRGQVSKVYTAIVRESGITGRQVRILDCLGLRAQESPARAKKVPFVRNERMSNGKRIVDTWLPIHEWMVEHVWARIKGSGVPHHYAYDLGMPRLSCVFCVLAPKSALMVAAKHNPELAQQYVELEQRIDHTFKHGLSMAQVVAEAEATDEVTADDWRA